MRKVLFLSVICLFLLDACSVGGPAATPTASPPPFLTATLVPTLTLGPTFTPAPPTITPTIAPQTGVVTAQVNVRAAPDPGQASLGLLNYLDKVQIMGKDAGGKWWRIVYPGAPSGFGWVMMQFVQYTGDVDKIPVIQVAPNTATPAPDAASLYTPTPSPRTAVVTQKINVRSGPATANDSLGMIDANTTVVLTGRNQINTWVQIEYPAGPGGKGWVAALYLNNPDLSGLAYYDNQGVLVYAPTQSSNPGGPSLTPTSFAPAAADNDSETHPAVNQTFSPDAAAVLTYSSDLSAPTGDAADWVAFTPYGPSNQSTYVYLRLDCTGNGGVTATLEKDGRPVPDTKQLVCGNYDLAMKVLGSQEYVLVLNADGSGGPLRYVNYTLTIKVTP